MYMGFMRMGLSFMLGFMLMIAVMSITGLDVLVVFPITLYIYSFFHANNIGSLDNEHFAALDDEYLFGFGDMERIRFRLDRKNRNLAAVVLIVLGIYMRGKKEDSVEPKVIQEQEEPVKWTGQVEQIEKKEEQGEA